MESKRVWDVKFAPVDARGHETADVCVRASDAEIAARKGLRILRKQRFSGERAMEVVSVALNCDLDD